MDDSPDGKNNLDVSNGNDTTESTDTTPSSENPNDASPPDARASEKVTAPEPPRWRFVTDAKKSLGYSSLHAGSYIRGQSNNELGAKYVAPDISLYKSKKDTAEVQTLDYQLPTNKSLTKEDVVVGKLSDNVPSQNAFPSQGNEVGKLTIQQVKPNELNSPSGTFAGLPKFESPTDEPRKSFKEWETNLQVGPKKEREHEWWDGKIPNDSYTMPGDDTQSKTRGEVGKIKFHGSGEGEESFVGEIAKKNPDHDGDGVDGFNDNVDYGDAREGNLFIHNNSSAYSATDEDIANEKDSNDSTALTEPVDDENEKKKRRCLYLLLLLPLLLGIVLGVVMGRENGDERAVVAGAVAGVLIPPIVVVNETTVPSSYPSASPSIEQSLQPSLSPSMECPVGTEPFTIEHLHHSGRHLPTTVNEATWKIRDACSGEVIAQCLPCSKGRLASPQPDSALTQTRNDGPTRRLEEKPLKTITECLPINNAYVLEIIPVEDTDACCGFDHTTSIISYDDVVVKDVASSDSIFDVESKMSFGERETPCASESPSILPSSFPTAKPTCSTEQEFNLCVAVDMSGSVCNDSMGSKCLACQAAFLPIFFTSECRDSFVSEDTCCNNFANVKEFSSLMVNLLGDFPAEKSFSVVQFATNAQLVSGLSSAAQTLPVINQLDYTGGLTNHARAIQMCQQTLPTFDNRKNFIMLITDGVSSEPEFDPEGAAETAATSAKNDGTFIIPVFISSNNDWSALAFMRRLSSDGKVFDVTDFDSLNGLQDRLVDQVSCS